MKIHFLLITAALLSGQVAFSQKNKLPLIITPPVGQTDGPLVIFLSGDGGWHFFCQPFSDKLASTGLPVIGWNCKKYFWETVQPEKAAADFSKVLEEYMNKWNRHSAVLIGLSFGGDVMPFIYNHLPDDVKQKIKLVVLLSPSKTTDFEVHYADMIGIGGDKYPHNVIEAVGKIGSTPVLCVYGDQETSVFPAGFGQANVQFGVVKGTHYYTDIEGVSHLVWKQLSRLD
ncbi:MAG: hypothetical protein EPO28_10125 [Saprospiraceae bacterium]|nr:MAG: hypothetical protein EPO28_10125 [Saprospiraceae bacterium]